MSYMRQSLFFKIIFFSFFVMFVFQAKLVASTDTTQKKDSDSPIESKECAAAQEEDEELPLLQTENTPPSDFNTKKNSNFSPTPPLSPSVNQKTKKLLAKKSKEKSKTLKKTKSTSKTKRKSRFWSFFSKFIELDWLMVAIFTIIPALLIAGLYLLLKGTVLSFFEMFLFALGFGVAIFAFWFAGSENDTGTALYEYFIKYGIFSWVGILMIIAGFVGLFGGAGGSLLGYMFIGAILGAISFLISIFKKNSILNK